MKRYIIIVILSFTILLFMLSNVASRSPEYYIPYIKTVNPINFQTPSYNQYNIVSNSGSYSDIILLENQNNNTNILDSRLLMKHVFNETQYPLNCK